MPAMDNQSRGYFRTMHSRTIETLRKVRTEEKSLRKKSILTPQDNEELDRLFDARMRVYDNIVALSDAEDEYRRSRLGTVQALRALKRARDDTASATKTLQDVKAAIDAIATVGQIITNLVSIITRV